MYNGNSGSPDSGPVGANLGAIAGREPVGDTRGWLRNLATQEDFSFWFRPQPVKQALRAHYDSMAVVGMSHEYQTYSHTGSDGFSFEVYVNRLLLVKAGAQAADAQNRQRGAGNLEGGQSDLQAYSAMMEDGRRFLQALLYAPAGVTGVIGGSPPPCILVLPGVCTMRCRLQSLDFEFTDVDVEGFLKEFTASVSFQEAPMGRITMEDVRANGSFRVWGEM